MAVANPDRNAAVVSHAQVYTTELVYAIINHPFIHSKGPRMCRDLSLVRLILQQLSRSTRSYVYITYNRSVSTLVSFPFGLLERYKKAYSTDDCSSAEASGHTCPLAHHGYC
jgi:hypothetical protein